MPSGRTLRFLQPGATLLISQSLWWQQIADPPNKPRRNRMRMSEAGEDGPRDMLTAPECSELLTRRMAVRVTMIVNTAEVNKKIRQILLKRGRIVHSARISQSTERRFIVH